MRERKSQRVNWHFTIILRMLRGTKRMKLLFLSESRQFMKIKIQPSPKYTQYKNPCMFLYILVKLTKKRMTKYYGLQMTQNSLPL